MLNSVYVLGTKSEIKQYVNARFCAFFTKTLAFKIRKPKVDLMYQNVQNFAQTQCVSFHRSELSIIISLYGRMVALGEWRDYGISALKDVAIFSIFRHTAEHPIYRIEKRPKLAGKQGMYSVIGMDGRILKRGSDLKTVLRVLERKMIRLVD